MKKRNLEDLIFSGIGFCGNAQNVEKQNMRLYSLSKKKVVYLDQLAYSLILKSTKQNKGDKWQALGENIGQLVEDQVIVCPYSDIHQTETEFYRTYYDEITELYRRFSLGISFKHTSNIEQHQLRHSLGSFLNQKNKMQYQIDRGHALSDDPNDWASRFSLHVNIKINLADVEKREALKKDTHSRIQKLYDDVLTKEDKTFEEDFDIEKTTSAEFILNHHNKNINIMRGIMSGEMSPEEFLNLQIDHTEWIIPEIELHPPFSDNPAESLIRFLSSGEFYETPYVFIWAYLFASLDQKVRKSKRKARGGDYHDIRALSNYLPYCDAMISDNEFRGMLEERGGEILKRYNTLVFSGKTLDGLFALFNRWASESPIDEIRNIYRNLDRTSLV